ncbi:MAG: hypothetical protein Q7V20_21330 [Aquabacterium sp.]|uniref:hypothetical protein n=1 Tax=Aquabacterium sp. TaxID=1872578 RepID=UPI00272004B4|nr:hypothetical protein [Aquabacterium sp.]MDO9005995.1 hypothetical protein [Aquabacterium sp.]
MGWVKKGLIFKPDGQHDWVKTHAMLPVADHLGGDLYRIYFSGRDEQNRSLTGYVEIDITNPQDILKISSEPVLGLGSLGAFDDNGVSPTWMVNHQGSKYLYYFGWNKGSLVRAAEVSGLAISKDAGATFQRFSRAPVIDRTDAEPYQILVISCILIEGNLWRMWYDSADEWQTPELPRYNVKYAESADGINWVRKGIVSVNYKCRDESRVSRASVIKEDGIYKMWHCYAMNSGGYRMGYAESTDGYQFERKDDGLTIQVSPSGWDSEMVCYPHVFKHRGQKMMLYCGNGYGRTGFGLAVEE